MSRARSIPCADPTACILVRAGFWVVAFRRRHRRHRSGCPRCQSFGQEFGDRPIRRDCDRCEWPLPAVQSFPGDYELDVSAESYSTNSQKVTVTAGAGATANVTLAGVLSLQDLGIAASDAQGTSEAQARLNKRSHMLMIHQRLGLIAAVPLIATVATSFGAGGRSTSTGDRWAHLILGSAAGDLYFTSAYFAIRAPGIPGTQRRGPIRVHRALAWIHGPGMILTPILGAIAFDQKSKGERVHGIASAHGAVAIVTAAAYGAAIISVSFKF